MERGSDKHSARMDDALEHEVHGLVQGNRATHVEEWNSPEPSGEDQPEVQLSGDTPMVGGVPDGMTEADVEERSRLAQVLGKSVWPATGAQLLAVAQSNQAPDRLLQLLRHLPADQSFENLQHAWAQLSGGHVESHRF